MGYGMLDVVEGRRRTQHLEFRTWNKGIEDQPLMFHVKCMRIVLGHARLLTQGFCADAGANAGAGAGAGDPNCFCCC